MPKSRKRRGVKVAHVPNRKAALVEQRRVAMIVNDLDELMRAVPIGYNPTNLADAVEHHHASAALVAYMRDQRVVDLLAALAGGDMVVMPDSPEAEAEAIDSGHAEVPEGADRMSYAEMVERQLPTRTPGASTDASGRTVAEADQGDHVKAPTAMVDCGHCARPYRARKDGRPYAHKRYSFDTTSDYWCVGGGPAPVIPAPRREVIR
jgi:hypothetical protein